MDNFDLKKYLSEGKLLKENALEKLADITLKDVSKDVKEYLNSEFEDIFRRWRLF
jgi:hypothetical protein